MKYLIFICFILQSFAHIYAASDSKSFLSITDIGSSARSIGLGGVEGFSNSSEATFENPAALHRIKKAGFSLYSLRLMGDIDYLNVTVGTSVRGLGTFSAGFLRASTAAIPETGLNGLNQFIVKDTFDYKSSVMKLSYQGKLNFGKTIYYGISYSYYFTEFYSVSGKGHNADIGLLYDGSNLGVSVVAKNIIALDSNKFKYKSGEEESFTPQTIATLRYRIKDLTLYPQATVQSSKFLLSGGLSFTPSQFPFVTLIGGYRERLDVLLKKHSGFSVGLGMSFYGFNAYYSYERSSHPSFKNRNYFSINYNF